jgi:hypothetical protein
MVAAYWLRASLGVASHRGAVMLPPVGRPWGSLGENVDFSKKMLKHFVFMKSISENVLKNVGSNIFSEQMLVQLSQRNVDKTFYEKCWFDFYLKNVDIY